MGSSSTFASRIEHLVANCPRVGFLLGGSDDAMPSVGHTVNRASVNRASVNRASVNRALRLLCLVLSALITVNAAAETHPPASASALETSEASIPLPPLPPMPEIDASPPTVDARTSLQTRLAALQSTSLSSPLATEQLAFLSQGASSDLVPAIRERLEELREELDGDRATALLERARAKGRRAIRAYKRAHKDEPEPAGDWLAFIVALENHEAKGWRSLAELYALLRVLETVGTTDAVRQMIASYSYFGELVRIDLQRAITRLDEKAVPALIEAKQHDARKVRRWATKRLDQLGRAITGEAAATIDPHILADVLLAFGRVRDLDATRIILSFTSSDRVHLRTAARAAIGAMGKPIRGFVRNAYKDLTGSAPPKEWEWERLARELFRLHDVARLRVVYEQMDAGTDAAKAGRYDDAVAAFDDVLSRVPLFDRRSEMTPAYFEHAKQLIEKAERERALLLLHKALRLDPNTPHQAAIESRIAMLEGERLLENGEVCKGGKIL